VRGFLAAVVRKKLGLRLESEKTDGERVYRIANNSSGPPSSDVTTIAVPWTSPVPARVNGIIPCACSQHAIQTRPPRSSPDRDSQSPQLDRRDLPQTKPDLVLGQGDALDMALDQAPIIIGATAGRRPPC
jgi:hypothetical protein